MPGAWGLSAAAGTLTAATAVISPAAARFGRYLGDAVPLVVQYGKKAAEGDDELREYVLQVCGRVWDGGGGRQVDEGAGTAPRCKCVTHPSMTCAPESTQRSHEHLSHLGHPVIPWSCSLLCYP